MTRKKESRNQQKPQDITLSNSEVDKFSLSDAKTKLYIS